MKPTSPQSTPKSSGNPRRRVSANGAATLIAKGASVSTEASIERRCAKHAALQGCYLWKVTAILGAPDRLCLLPNGRHFFVEFKKPGGEMTPIQRHVQSRLVAMGHNCFEVDNVHLFKRLLAERLALPTA